MSASSPAASESRQWRTVLWVLVPVVAALLLRAWVQAQAGGLDDGLQRLRLATLVSSPGQAFWVAARPFLLSLLAGVLLVLGLRQGVRRLGWARLRPGLTAAWVLGWLAFGGWLLAGQLNRSGASPLPTRQVEVLLVREVPPSQRSPGGVEVYVQPPAGQAPLRLLVEEGRSADFPLGSAARLDGMAGRWWGHWARLQPVGNG